MKKAAQRTLLNDEGHRPSEDIHEARKVIRMGTRNDKTKNNIIPEGKRAIRVRLIELTNVNDVVLIAENGTLVVIRVKVVGGREEGDHGGEARLVVLTMHPVAMTEASIGRLGLQRRRRQNVKHTQHPEPREHG